MASNNADNYRARAAQARRIAENMHSHQARIELIEMAEALDAEADGLEQSEASDPPSPTARGISGSPESSRR